MYRRKQWCRGFWFPGRRGCSTTTTGPRLIARPIAPTTVATTFRTTPFSVRPSLRLRAPWEGYFLSYKEKVSPTCGTKRESAFQIEISVLIPSLSKVGWYDLFDRRCFVARDNEYITQGISGPVIRYGI